MRKRTISTALFILMICGCCWFSSSARSINYCQVNPLVEYTGKYQVVQKRGTVGIKIELVNCELVCTQSWDGEKLLLRHLTGDNFIMAGFDWSVKFLRGKDKKISQILVMGTDRWDKVKE